MLGNKASLSLELNSLLTTVHLLYSLLLTALPYPYALYCRTFLPMYNVVPRSRELIKKSTKFIGDN